VGVAGGVPEVSKDDVIADVSGLQLSNSTFSASPPGALSRAEECVMPQKGVIEPRRGQERSATLPTADSLPFTLTQFDGSTIVSYSTSKQGASYGLGRQVGSTVTAYSGGPYNPVDTDGATELAARLKFGFSGEYLHFCTTTGPKVLETASGTPRTSGLLQIQDPRAVMASASLLSAADGAGLEYGYSRAYRTVLRKPTDNGTSLLSPPSGRAVVTNRIVAPIGSMVRLANVVTVTLPGTTDPGLNPGDTFDIDPGEASFPIATETVATQTANVITYADIAANATSTVEHNLNTGPRPVGLTIWLSEDTVAGTMVRIYRSRDTSTEDPDDEMFLVAELAPTGTNITNGFMMYLDITPQSVTDDPLYTNPLTGGGARSANYRAPVYRDVAQFGDQTFYANTTGNQLLRVQMLGVGSPDGIQDGDTFGIGALTLTFRNIPAGVTDVQIVSNGLPAFNIQSTAQNLVDSANANLRAAGTPIRAYYESPQDSAPGKILITATSVSQAAFIVAASRAASWVPAMNAVTTAAREPNQLVYSKPSEPESVPPLNYLTIGSKNYPIARIIALKQALLVFKEGDGVWTVTGSAPFSVLQISTANILAYDTACSFADAAWVYSDEGILRISDAGGSAVVSRPIETELNEQYRRLPTETAAYSFAVPYEQQRQILFFVPFSFTVDDGPDRPIMRAWCYNSATQAWTGPLYSDAFSGCVIIDGENTQDGKHYELTLGVYDGPWVTSRITSERAVTSLDSETTLYADESFAVTISEVNVNGDPLFVRLSSMTDIEAGDGLAQAVSFSGVQRFSNIRSIREDVGAGVVELYEEQPFIATAAFALKHYDATVQFQPHGSPSLRKTLTRLAWLFKPSWFSSLACQTLVATDQIQADKEILTQGLGFGMMPFGATPFGDPSPLVVDVNPNDAKWTNASQFFVGMSLPVCLSRFKLQGVVMRTETADGPNARGR
jgi:hypothetical protein